MKDSIKKAGPFYNSDKVPCKKEFIHTCDDKTIFPAHDLPFHMGICIVFTNIVSVLRNRRESRIHFGFKNKNSFILSVYKS